LNTSENKPTREIVEAWLGVVDGEFHYTKACDGIFDRSEYPHLRMIFKRAKERGLVENVGNKDGYYRVTQNLAQPLDWQDYEAHADSGLVLPFDLRKWAFIYPDTTTVIAGSKSSGKTGFLYRTVVLNMLGKRKVKLLTNLEQGIGALKDRFSDMDVNIPKPAPFDVIPVYENHHDYIKDRDTIYIIDYIDCPDGESFYKIAHYIKKIDHKLAGLNSLAVVGLQKHSGRDIGFGGEGTLQVATLYLAIDTGKLKIVDCKVPVDNKIHPKNMQFTFTYEDSGTKFTNLDPYWGE
jgi:hypothetical protein